MPFQEFKGAKVLVTGGAGFIGSSLAHRLVALGADVTIIDSFLDGGGANLHNLDGISKQVTLIRADLSYESSKNHVVEFDYIFNLASQTGHKESLINPVQDLRLNVLSTINLLEAARQNCPGAIVVYTGSRDQYGLIQVNPVKEDHPILPIDPNGISKHAAEQYHFLYTKAYGLKTTSLRLTNVYGPRVQIRTSKQGFIGWFVNLALSKRDITVFGDGKQLRDVLHVDDAVEAILLAAINKKAIGQAFNIASGKPISVIEIAEKIVKLAGSGKVKKVPFPEENKKIEIGDYVGDIRKAKKILGWEPKVGFDQGMKQTIAYYKKNLKEYS